MNPLDAYNNCRRSPGDWVLRYQTQRIHSHVHALSILLIVCSCSTVIVCTKPSAVVVLKSHTEWAERDVQTRDRYEAWAPVDMYNGLLALHVILLYYFIINLLIYE